MKPKFLTLILLLAGLTPALAQLTTTVYPGYTLQPGERVTIDKLNLMAQPTVLVSGSSTGMVISAGSITASSITTNAFDQLTILGGWDGSAATPVRVGTIADTNVAANAAIAWSKIALGTNLIAASNLVLSVSSNILHGNNSNGVLAAVTAGSGLVLTNNTLAVSNLTFTTAEYELAEGRISTNHGLGGLPTWVRWVMVCKTNDVGYAAGEEIGVDGAGDSDQSSARQFVQGASSTALFLIMQDANVYINNGTNGDATTQLTEERWRVKGYARP